jgi:hypothetical protein
MKGGCAVGDEEDEFFYVCRCLRRLYSYYYCVHSTTLTCARSIVSRDDYTHAAPTRLFVLRVRFRNRPTAPRCPSPKVHRRKASRTEAAATD